VTPGNSGDGVGEDRHHGAVPDPTVPTITETPRTALRRKKERGRFDRETVNAILDEGLVCHIGLVFDGSPVVLPTAYGRISDQLYVHGAAANHMFRAMATGVDACVTVTLLDGLVLARSTFHHSMNYRSVVLLGRGVKVTDDAEKCAALDAIVEHIVPGRSAEARAPTPEELRATLVVRFPIEEGSAKIRVGGPVDDEPDHLLEVWAGVLPLRVVAGPPEVDVAVPSRRPVPPYVTGYRRGATA
jgi:nitroimidazol reductase NimA-like FMN-containing flavoprotein (pyridoxamine 5'-phosphate oxidase superfamily)